MDHLLKEIAKIPGGYRYDGAASTQYCFPLRAGGELRLFCCDDDVGGDGKWHFDWYDGSLPPCITGPSQITGKPDFEVEAEPVATGWVGVVWDVDEETGAKSCAAMTETLDTRAEALKWARRHAEDMKVKKPRERKDHLADVKQAGRDFWNGA